MKPCATHKWHFNGIAWVCRRCGWWKKSADDAPNPPLTDCGGFAAKEDQ